MIRKEVEKILELHITEWSDTWRASEQQGKLTNSRTNLILLKLCEAMEELQNEKVLPKKSS